MNKHEDELPFANHKNEIERQIIVLLIEDFLANGYRLTVNDGEEDVLDMSTDASAIFKAMSTTDDEILFFEHPIAGSGWLRLVYGNGAYVISDHTVNLEPVVLKRAEALAERFA